VTARWTIACDRAELLVECARGAEALGLPISPAFDPDPARVVADALLRAEPAALVVASPPSPPTLVSLARCGAETRAPVAVAILGPPDRVEASVALAGDLGIVAVDEVRPLVSALALLGAGASRPWSASTRPLPEVDRLRLAHVMEPAERGAGRLSREDDALLGWRDRGAVVCIGEPRDVALAIGALRAAHDGGVDAAPPVPRELEPRSVLDVIFGPPRALSDPASKSALAPYGVPVPLEELCTSPSRAAAEAARIGFPIRIALASPDLRVWDHPDLAVDGVDGAARVKEVFRQVMTLGRSRAPGARLLGVTVMAASTARALLRITASPLPDGLALVEIGFADAHGVAAGDHTLTALPASEARIGRVLGRLAGSELLLAPGRQGSLEAITDVLLKVAAFVDDWRDEVTSVQVDPLAVLVGGGIEAREACVTVGDAFLRTLELPATGL